MVKVFKFGGFSVSDAESIKNLANIIAAETKKELLIIVSAMGKTTDALERLCAAYVEKNKDSYDILNQIKEFHEIAMVELFENNRHPVFDEIANTFVEIEWMLEDEPHPNYDFNYDQIVSIGEFLSSKIVSAYLNKLGLNSKWVDARDFIHTDNTYREGIIDIEKTNNNIKNLEHILKNQIVVSQGFIGGTSENFTTTLGREGSDYSAAIFASALNAESLTVWKDVEGIMNADPRIFSDAKKYDELPYSEALEMAYYGATIIHPKTVKPLQNVNVPLYVKAFLNPKGIGTLIHSLAKFNSEIPAKILKKNQILLSISSKDFSFIDEQVMIYLFEIIQKTNLKSNLIQRSALSLSICFNEDENKLKNVLAILNEKFNCKYERGLNLLTLRHYKKDDINSILQGKPTLLEQFTRNTAQLIYK